MPIHDQGYRRYGGERAGKGRSWLVITRAGLRAFLGRKVFLGLLLLSWMPFFVGAFQIYLAVNVPQAAFLAPTASTFRKVLAWQEIPVFFMTVYVGAGLIANDRRANALQIYLSKPMTRAEYVCGKLGILMTFLLLITWLPGMLLLVMQIVFAGSFTFLWNNLFLLPAITLFTFIQAVVAGMSMLALSSLSNNSRYVGILYAALIFFTQPIYAVLRSATGTDVWSAISMTNNLVQVGDRIFRMPLRYGPPWPTQPLMLLVVVAASVLILTRRIRGVEVVA